MGQWDTVLKGRVNLVTDQQKRTVSVVALWDTLFKEMLLTELIQLNMWDSGTQF